MKKTITSIITIWFITSITIIIIIFSYKQTKEKQIRQSFFETAKIISKQRVDAGIRVLSKFYENQIENEKEKFLIIDKMIKQFNINQDFSYKNIQININKFKHFTSQYIFYKDIINEDKRIYIYENIKYINQKIYDTIPSLFDAFRFGKNGYVFVYDDKGNCYYHFNKKYIGKNRWNLKRNGTYILQLIINKAKQNPHGVYVSYIGFNPNGKPTKKISYVTYFEPLHLVLGSGIYLKDLDTKIDNFNKELLNMFKQAEASLIFTLIIIFILRMKNKL